MAEEERPKKKTAGELQMLATITGALLNRIPFNKSIDENSVSSAVKTAKLAVKKILN